MFSLINFIAVSADKSSFHTIILKTSHKQSNTLSCTTIKYIFLLIEIRYFIVLAINTHIDCANNCQAVFGAFSKQQQGALKVCLSAFSVKYDGGWNGFRPFGVKFIQKGSGGHLTHHPYDRSRQFLARNP